MAINSTETFKLQLSCETEKKLSESYLNSKKANETVSRIPKSLGTRGARVRAKTTDGVEERGRAKSQRSASANNAESLSNITKSTSEVLAKNKTSDPNEEDTEKKNLKPIEKLKTTLQKGSDVSNKSGQGRKKILIYKKPSESFYKFSQENSDRKIQKESTENQSKEIFSKLMKKPNKMTPVKKTSKPAKGAVKTNPPAKVEDGGIQKLSKDDGEEKIKNAAKENFSTLVPLYDTELKKMTDTWVNSIYCSLSTRTNLIKLLFQGFPQIDRSQFQVEDEILIHSLNRAKKYNKTEETNLLQLVKSLLKNRNKVKERYCNTIESKEIAKSFNHNWRGLMRKIADLEEEAKQLQEEIPELEKKKASIEESAKSQIENMEATLLRKEEEIKKLAHQLNLLKQRENSFKGNVLMKVQEYKDIKADVVSLKTVEKELDELKDRYSFQKNMFEKKIQDLETLVSEKKKLLDKETEAKNNLLTIVTNLQTHQKHMTRSIGKEQVEYIMGRAYNWKSKRRELLWVTAINLVMKGFILQMRRLERERNKMLLELNSNDLENFNTIATSILQKEMFMKSIKNQINSFHKVAVSKK